MSLTLVVRRVIAAPPERLFEAWTQATQLQTWWGPKGVRCVGAEIDLRVGGKYRIGNAMPDGSVLWICGEFELVAPPRKLVYSWSIESAASAEERVSVSFEPHAQGTEVIVLHERIASPEKRDEHAYGWDGCLDGLAARALRRNLAL